MLAVALAYLAFTINEDFYGMADFGAENTKLNMNIRRGHGVNEAVQSIVLIDQFQEPPLMGAGVLQARERVLGIKGTVAPQHNLAASPTLLSAIITCLATSTIPIPL